MNTTSKEAPNSIKKRKADSLGRIARSSGQGDDDSSKSLSQQQQRLRRGGRGALTGWTLCPLCESLHSKKLYSIGRGIASHLHAVHTPWNPGKLEKKKRRRLAEQRARSGDRPAAALAAAAVGIDEQAGDQWDPTQQETSDWDDKVLQILAQVEKAAAGTTTTATTSEDGGVSLVVRRVDDAPGLDRNGKETKPYRESLPLFLQAAANGDLERLQRMVREASDSCTAADNVIKLVATRDRHQSSAEHWAAGGGHLSCLKYLVSLKTKDTAVADTKKTRRRDGKTCLHYAARNGHVECIRYLVNDQKHAVDVVSGDGTTPLHLACFGGHLAAVECLISLGANCLATNEWGCGAAHWVGMTQNKSDDDIRQLCRILQTKGVNFSVPQKQGHSPLHKAAQRGNRHVIEWMAQPKQSGGAGLTAAEKIKAGLADQGGHVPSEIWRSLGGDEGFCHRMEIEWSW